MDAINRVGRDKDYLKPLCHDNWKRFQVTYKVRWLSRYNLAFSCLSVTNVRV